MEKIIILDFGSQVTQLIGRRLREINVFCEIYPYNKVPALDDSVKGIILSGSPCSVRDANAPKAEITTGKIPVLGICYGAQYLAHTRGGKVEASNTREYGRAILRKVADSPLLKDISPKTQVWMSHGDTISKLPEGAEVIASTADVENAAYQFKDEPTYAVQFHPEVYHTTEGAKILANFALNICGCKGDWTPDSFIETTVAELKAIIGQDKVILGLSGGVDSTVAAMLLNKAIGSQLLELGMPQARFEIRVAPLTDYGPQGLDEVGFYFSANPGEEEKLLQKVASGGELSRIALAIKTVAASRDASVPSMVFDEIDTGIGGRTAQMVAERIALVAGYKQVLCITHLPQIACMADVHLYIAKHSQGEQTQTNVHALSPRERVSEIARMASGADATAASLDNAREMMQHAQQKKARFRQQRQG